MDGGAATAAVEVLVQNLINICKEEISLIRGLETEAGKLEKTLDMIQGFLDDAEKKFIPEEAVKTWLKELEAVAFDADTVLDELNYHVLSKKMETLRKADQKKKLPSCFPSFNHCLRRRRMALTVKGINTTFESVNKRATVLGLVRKLENAPAAPTDAGLETASFTSDPIFIGREDDVSEVVKILTRSANEQVFSILPITGMGGLGKTTLARKVFKDEGIKNCFGKHIWVHVSRNFDPVSLLGKILSTLTSSGNDEVRSKEVILQLLQEALEAKTYLLVLDDVWNEDAQKWEDFINSLTGITSVKGNGIVVTTRNTEVASIVQTLPIYELKGLLEESCWSIIKAKTFGGGDIPPGFKQIGEDIAKRCQGLPLAANVVGGVLRGKSRDEWLSIKDNWLSDAQGDENAISKILKLSFDHLSSSLKKCFAYCSIFPKGALVERNQLIELWMAEGFLLIDQSNDFERVGSKFFDLLLQNSLLQVVERDDYGNVTRCSMHDLVHDLAYSLPGRKYYGDESSPVPKEKAKCLRTLFFDGKISDLTFSDFKSLHALTLSYYDVEELSSSIGDLIHLRYLNISCTSISHRRIQNLPDSIGKLYYLQTLRVDARFLRKLPDSLKYLISLRHLYTYDDVELPPELGMLTSLRTLPYFKVRDEKGHRIVELGSLKHLEGELVILNLEEVHGEEEAKKADLFQKSNIVKLILVWEGFREGEINDENVLEGLQPHPNLKILKICGFKGTRFPLWILKMAVRDEPGGCWVGLTNLMEIILTDCEECEEIPMLGHLPYLKSLYLRGLRTVKSIGSSFYGFDYCRSSNGVGKETVIVFPALERISLSDMPNLTEWVEVEEAETQPRDVKVFPCLKYLEITLCERLMRSPIHFPCLKESDIDTMDSGLSLANIWGIKLGSLTELTIWKSDGLVCLPDWLFRNNPNLSMLTIISCPNLRELPDDLHTLNSLVKLRIDQCPDLKTIPYSSGRQSQGLVSLRTLEITECQGLTNLPCGLVESCALSLEELELQNLSSLTNLPQIIDYLHHMPRLTRLTISEVPKLITTSSSSSTETGALCSLEYLTIAPTPNSSDCVVSFEKAVDAILKQSGSQSLRYLNLTGMEDLDSLPDSLQRLTALSQLDLKNFGVEELPDWFGKLTSLRRLEVSNCQKLRRLGCLPELTDLIIEGCPLLKQLNEDQIEWAKVSHFLDIRVDGSQFDREYVRNRWRVRASA